MIRLIEVCEHLSAANSSQRKYSLKEIYINPKHVVSLREEESYKQKLVEGFLPEDLDTRQSFTRITLDKGQTGLDIVVVGSPGQIEDKIKSSPHVLRG